MKGKNIVCWKLDDAQDTDSLLFTYTNDWTTANGNHYYKTANYTGAELKGNLYTYGSSFSFDGTGKKGYFINKVTFEKSPLAGKSVYFNTGTAVTNPKLKLVYTDGTWEEVEMTLSYNQECVYEYIFPDYVFPDTECYFSGDSGTTYVPTDGFVDINDSTPCYNLEKDIWEAFTPEETQIEILVVHDFSDLGGATVIFTKNGVPVSGLTYDIGTSSGKFTFDLTSTEYDGFYVKQKEDSLTGNTTETVSKSDIANAAKTYATPIMATVGEWVDENTKRTLTLGKYVSIPDHSLDIPVGTYTKENNILYINATFYDYYSDVELAGINRNTLTGAFNQTPGSEDKLQARTFNSAISEYFAGTSLAVSTTQSPLYFGEFTGASTSDLVNFIWENNNGVPNNSQARQGLVNDTLVNNQLVMGTDNTVVPYFNEAFLRGNNSTGGELGYVFENVEFPFVLNDDYWEFDSYDANQTVRMKQTSEGRYFLDRVGADNQVIGQTSDGTATGSNFFPFNDKEASYEAFAKQNYLQVPEGFEELKEQCEKQKLTDSEKIIQYVTTYLVSNYTYNMKVSKLPEDKDFVKYFLYESKEGYSAHFASAAVIMFRCFKIPARYVTGYAAPESIFAEDSDGNYTALLQSDNSHAWVEIYRSGFGWIPVETTPGNIGVLQTITREEDFAQQKDVAGEEIEVSENSIQPQNAPPEKKESANERIQAIFSLMYRKMKQAGMPEEDVAWMRRIHKRALVGMKYYRKHRKYK